MWGVLAINMVSPGVIALNGHLKGEDYSHFYVLGRLVKDGNAAALYDVTSQASYMKAVIPGAPPSYFVPIYGPQVAVLFAPFASVSYLPSFALWSAATILLYLACCMAVLRACPLLQRQRTDVTLILIASPALWQLVVHGQNSILALTALTVGWLSLRGQRFLAAGFAFGVLFYKPQLGLAIGMALVLTGRWKVLAGMAVSAAAQLAVAVLMLGAGPVVAYVEMLTRLPQIAALLEPKPYLLHSFRAFFGMIPFIRDHAIVLSALCSAALLVAIVRHWRSLQDPDITFAALLIATVLISPHTSVYDLVILMPALLLIVDRMLAVQEARAPGAPVDRIGYALIAAVFMLPLLPFASQYLHVQPSVICLTWLLLRNTRIPPSEPVPLSVMKVLAPR